MKLFKKSVIIKVISTLIILIISTLSSSSSFPTFSKKAFADTTPSFTEFNLPYGENAQALATGPDSNIWFADNGNNSIGKYIVSNGSISEYKIPTASASASSITTGPDGNLWFTDEPYQGSGKIGRITTNGNITEFIIPTIGNDNFHTPYAITSGPDGNLWFADGFYIGKITPQGAITEFQINQTGANGIPTDYNSVAQAGEHEIISGPDGNIWVALRLGGVNGTFYNSIGRVSPSGIITIFTLPNNSQNDYPENITPGPDGNLWFTEPANATIGRITPSGGITEYPLPKGDTFPADIVAGPDGNLWFTHWSGGTIGRITTNGVITEFPNLYNGDSSSIIKGPDGNIWFYDTTDESLVRVTLNGVTLTPTPTISFTPTPTPSPSPKGSIYVALGDSYSSGEGAPDPNYLPYTDDHTIPDKCHRSMGAYPELLDKEVYKNYPIFDFFACSGSTTRDFLNNNHEYRIENPQLSWLNLATGLVSLTIGGNNADFADVMQYCAMRDPFPYTSVATCKYEYNNIVNKEIANLANPTTDDTQTFFDGHNYGNPTLSAIYYDIGKRAPNAKKILVVGYPRLFKEKPPNVCLTGIAANIFVGSDMTWMNEEGKSLNDAIKKAVDRQNALEHNNRFVYVDIYDVFKGHELCTGDPYINRAVIDRTNPDLIKLVAWSFHPNVLGQQAIANYISKHYASDLK